MSKFRWVAVGISLPFIGSTFWLMDFEASIAAIGGLLIGWIIGKPFGYVDALKDTGMLK